MHIYLAVGTCAGSEVIVGVVLIVFVAASECGSRSLLGGVGQLGRKILRGVSRDGGSYAIEQFAPFIVNGNSYAVEHGVLIVFRDEVHERSKIYVLIVGGDYTRVDKSQLIVYALGSIGLLPFVLKQSKSDDDKPQHRNEWNKQSPLIANWFP